MEKGETIFCTCSHEISKRLGTEEMWHIGSGYSLRKATGEKAPILTKECPECECKNASIGE